jgi:predicted small metal-binding protein
MSLVVHCPCGTDLSGESEDELVTAVEAHVTEKHPEKAGELGREQILEMAHEHGPGGHGH